MNERMKLSKAIKRYQDETKNKDHINEYSQFKRFLEVHGDIFIDEINRKLINEFVEKRIKDEVSETTINRTLQKIRALLNKAKREWEILKGHDLPYIRLFKETNNGRVRWLNLQEVARLVEKLREHTAQMMLFTLETGLRETNITQLRWNQIDLKKGIIYIEGADILKSERPFVVPLSKKAIAILKAEKGKHPERVFTYCKKPISKANTKAFRNAVKECGIKDFRWHDLRHTWATRHIQRDTPLNILQRLGGWSDLKSVQRYAHYSYREFGKYLEGSDGEQNVVITEQGCPTIKVKKLPQQGFEPLDILKNTIIKYVDPISPVFDNEWKGA